MSEKTKKEEIVKRMNESNKLFVYRLKLQGSSEKYLVLNNEHVAFIEPDSNYFQNVYYPWWQYHDLCINGIEENRQMIIEKFNYIENYLKGFWSKENDTSLSPSDIINKVEYEWLDDLQKQLDFIDILFGKKRNEKCLGILIKMNPLENQRVFLIRLSDYHSTILENQEYVFDIQVMNYL